MSYRESVWEVPPDIVDIETELKELAHLYYFLVRKRQGLEMMAEKMWGNIGRRMDYILEELGIVETRLRTVKSRIDVAVQEHPVWIQWGQYVKGLGKTMLGILLGVAPPRRFPLPSALLKYTGWAPPEVYGGRRIGGVRRWVVFQIAMGLIRSKGFYRSIYEKFRFEEDQKHPDYPAARRFRRALRKLIRLFIHHYWEVYISLFGYAKRLPYEFEKGLKPMTQYIPPHIDIPTVMPWSPAEIEKIVIRSQRRK